MSKRKKTEGQIVNQRLDRLTFTLPESDKRRFLAALRLNGYTYSKWARVLQTAYQHKAAIEIDGKPLSDLLKA